MSTPETRPLRWLQFSLRTLFVVILLVAAFFGGRESMRPAIQAERAKVLRAQELAERERALALASEAQAEWARLRVMAKKLRDDDAPQSQRPPDRP